MNLVSSDCIILRAQDYSERDKLVSFLTPESGRLKGIVKGSRKLTSRGVGSFEPFSRGLIHYVPRSPGALVAIRKCDPRPPYLYLRQDYHCFLYAGYLAELVDLCAIENREAAPYFTLLAETLDALCEAGPARRLPLLRLRFELRHLELLGYAPDWRTCRQCGSALLREGTEPVGASGGKHGAVDPVFDGTHGFEVRLGGVLCPPCDSAGQAALKISPGALVFLENWRGGGQATIRPTRAILQELEDAVTAHLIHHLERRPRSLALLPTLDELEEAPPP
ncbi:MAG: DNA repair protein RecO [bacterium]